MDVRPHRPGRKGPPRVRGPGDEQANPSGDFAGIVAAADVVDEFRKSLNTGSSRPPGSCPLRKRAGRRLLAARHRPPDDAAAAERLPRTGSLAGPPSPATVAVALPNPSTRLYPQAGRWRYTWCAQGFHNTQNPLRRSNSHGSGGTSLALWRPLLASGSGRQTADVRAPAGLSQVR